MAQGKAVRSILTFCILFLTLAAGMLQAQPVSYEMVQEPGDTNNGDPVELIVYLGTVEAPVAPTSHLIFTFSYDPETYDPGSSLSLDLSNSYFIGPGQQYTATLSADEQARTLTLDIENLSSTGAGHGEVARVVGGMLVVADVLKDEELISSTSRSDVQVYPTVVSDHFKVRGTDISGAVIEVLDLQGRIVERVQVPADRTQYTVPVTHMDNGLYKVRMAAEATAQAAIGSIIKQ